MPSLKQMAGCTPIPSTPAVRITPTPIFGTNRCHRRCSQMEGRIHLVSTAVMGRSAASLGKFSRSSPTCSGIATTNNPKAPASLTIFCNTNLRPFKIMQQSQFCQWLWFYHRSHAIWYDSSKLLSCETLRLWSDGRKPSLAISALTWVTHLPLPYASTLSQPFQAGGRAVDQVGDVGVFQPCRCRRESHGARAAAAEAGAAIAAWQAKYSETTAVLLFPPSSAVVEEMLEMWVKLTQKPDKSAFIHWF